MARVFGIIGYPLGHTLSPLVHNWGFAHFGLDARYEAWPTEPAALPAFLARVRAVPIEGVSVTIPHKRAVMAAVDSVTDLGRAVGAINTLYWRGGKLWGENTDVEGFCRPLAVRNLAPEAALILGNGGVARAAAVGLKRLGVGRVAVTGRSPDKAAALAREFALEPVDWEKRTRFAASLLVNATPLGMSGRQEGVSPYPREALGTGQTVYDLVYNPYPTRFVADAMAAGCGVVSGLEMFLYQAVEQFRLWTGRLLPEDAVKGLLTNALYGA